MRLRISRSFCGKFERENCERTDRDAARLLRLRLDGRSEAFDAQGVATQQSDAQRLLAERLDVLPHQVVDNFDALAIPAENRERQPQIMTPTASRRLRIRTSCPAAPG